MSQNISEVFKRMQDKKKEANEIKKIYRNALSVNKEYQEVLEEQEALKIKKKKIEATIQADFKEELDKLEGLKLNISSDNQMLSDLALMQLIDGEEVQVVDDNKIKYDPIFTVKFKKN